MTEPPDPPDPLIAENDAFFEKIERAFRDLFDRARARSEIHFALSLNPEFRGEQDAGWSTADDVHRTFDEYLAFLRVGEFTSLKRVSLWRSTVTSQRHLDTTRSLRTCFVLLVANPTTCGRVVDINGLRALAPLPRAPVPRPSRPQPRTPPPRWSQAQRFPSTSAASTPSPGSASRFGRARFSP